MRYFLRNQRRDPADDRLFIATEYEYGGNTKVLPPDGRTEVTEAEAQVCLARFQTVGVTIEYERD